MIHTLHGSSVVTDRQVFDWRLRNGQLRLGTTTRLMGILNVTPDSFSDGGRYANVAAAVAYGQEMVEAGADIIDVGGESTRPGAKVIDEKEEMARVLPVIEALASTITVPISIDTYKASVADAALKAGASIVNDISGFRFDARMPEVVARHGAGAL